MTEQFELKPKMFKAINLRVTQEYFPSKLYSIFTKQYYLHIIFTGKIENIIVNLSLIKTITICNCLV